MRTSLATCVVVFLLLVVAARSHSDDVAQTSPSPGVGEPITDQAATPNPGDESEVKDPFAPYGIGPPEEAVPLEELTPEEQAAATRVRNNSAGTLDRYRSAVLQQSARVTSEVAARKLGVDNLDAVGVVP